MRVNSFHHIIHSKFSFWVIPAQVSFLFSLSLKKSLKNGKPKLALKSGTFFFDISSFYKLVFCKLSILLKHSFPVAFFSFFSMNSTRGEEISSIMFWNSGNTIISFRKFCGSCFYLLEGKKGSHCDKLMLSIIFPFIIYESL